MMQNSGLESAGMSNASFRPLLHRLLFRSEEAKASLAREIHDGLSQKLVELSLSASLLDNDLAQEKVERPVVGQMSRQMLRLVQNAIDCAVHLKGSLHPQILEHFGLCSAIEVRAAEFEKETGIQTGFVAIDADLRLNPMVAAQVRAVMDQLLENVVRHAYANHVEIKLWQQKQLRQVWIEISDNGVGLTETQWKDPASLGLMEARERLTAVGGALIFDAKKRTGTCFQICVPVV